MTHAVLSNSRHPEYGQLTVPFPISRGTYDDTVAALASLGIGDRSAGTAGWMSSTAVFSS